MKYKAYNKKAVAAVMKRLAADTPKKVQSAPAPSFWDITKWPQWWEKGAAELEKTTPGKLITAPLRLPEAVITSTRKTVEEVPDVLKTVTKAVPIIAVTAGILGVSFLVYKFTKGNKEYAPASAEKMVL